LTNAASSCERPSDSPGSRARPNDLPLWALRTWLDSWSGIGRVAVGMARQGYDLQLTRYDERGWRATFDASGIEHSPSSATGTWRGWACSLVADVDCLPTIEMERSIRRVTRIRDVWALDCVSFPSAGGRVLRSAPR
jgi:hypothetical protein